MASSLGKTATRVVVAGIILLGSFSPIHALQAVSALQAAVITPAVSVTQTDDGVLVKTAQDQLRISVCGPSVLHILGGPVAPKPSAEHTPWILKPCADKQFVVTRTDKEAILSTSAMRVSIALDSGRLAFQDKNGAALLTEGGDLVRTYDPLRQPQGNTYRISEHFALPADEGLYGLGQHQAGVFNYRDTSTVLAQVNTDIAVPFLISTRGYGLMWNTAAETTFNNQFPKVMKLTASAGEGLDFYFLYGPEFDQVIHHYRELTGNAPLFGEWAYGLFQSKDFYSSQDQLKQIVREYRGRQIPMDTIVQDWKWWTHWGSNQFNPAYPDFAGAVRDIHADHAHVMISIWAKFDPETAVWKEMNQRGYLMKGFANYDATNPAARDLYWKMLPGTLLAKGVDAFWMDASEPEKPDRDGGIGAGQNIYFGNSDLYTNIYPFLHTYGVYQHWRATTEEKRVFILTRSSFLGQQHNAAAAWSGDVYSNFWALKRQVPAGLNFALSGMPYWTTDIGGYGDPHGDTSDPKYQEVYTRWFEFGTFCPLFRTHGHRENNQNELWSYGAATPTLVKFDKLRYRLLPYIYSLAWKVTSEDSTIMRPLVMDWRTDEQTWDVGDEFMFGPALLVSPVTEAGATSRRVYLPAAARWYDFWTGKQVAGGQHLEAAAPLDRIPLYVRAGSIVPMGPEIEYARQKPDAPIELRIYGGADGNFKLYEDEGDNYNYEKGAYSVIPMSWNEESKTLTIGARKGEFPGMQKERVFRVIRVGAEHGAGPVVAAKADREVKYSGESMAVVAP